MDKRAKESIDGFINYHMKEIQKSCDAFPTCEECPKNSKHTGCYFRGKSPKDWKTGK